MSERKLNQSWLYWSKRRWVTVASSSPPHSWMSFLLLPNQPQPTTQLDVLPAAAQPTALKALNASTYLPYFLLFYFSFLIYFLPSLFISLRTGLLYFQARCYKRRLNLGFSCYPQQRLQRKALIFKLLGGNLEVFHRCRDVDMELTKLENFLNFPNILEYKSLAQFLRNVQSL